LIVQGLFFDKFSDSDALFEPLDSDDHFGGLYIKTGMVFKNSKSNKNKERERKDERINEG